jgi:putative ABC transport system permease protein
LGLLFVAIVFRGFVHFAAGELPRLSEINLDTRVFGIALLVSFVTTLVFGGFPALRAGRVDIQPVLQQGGGIAGEYRLLRRVLVTGEVALSLVLLSGAALLLQTLWHLENDHLGFEPEHVLTVSVPLRGTKEQNDKQQTLAHELLSFVQRIPGTEAAALTQQCTPLSHGSYWVTFTRSDRPLPEQFHRGDGIGVCGVGPDYFKVSGTSVVQGRSFNDEDFAHPNTVAVINRAAARAYFPGENPLGKQIEGGRAAQWKTVVGIVNDTKNQGLNQPPMPEAFVNDLAPAIPPQLQIIVRSLGDQTALAPVIREKLRSLDPRLFAKFETLDQAIGEMTAAPRFNSILLASFAAIAFVMAIIGVYGVLAFAVTRRTQEIAIRIALGAEPRQVLALVVREGVLLVGVGSLFGIAGAIGLTRYLSALLYNVSPTDPITYLCVVIGLGIAAIVATWLPARKAASIDPMLSLRRE